MELEGATANFLRRRGVQCQIHASDIADKQGVAREKEPLIHQQTDMLGRVTGCMQHSDTPISYFQDLPISQGGMWKADVCPRPDVQRCVGHGCQLSSTRQMVGVRVRFNDGFHGHAVLLYL